MVVNGLINLRHCSVFDLILLQVIKTHLYNDYLALHVYIPLTMII